ncbi:hypothetical protein DL546_005165 [Coniochaeta pulveracea]|uniref:Uncharacterized protein n=1 Tax=Coniochaeta pulveracea TaxID=177199 RepID=A0A420Y1D8_9PEZI|nr:hypothetical protein DL546_005165 [Coniochaeta pulveracea]
MAAAAVFKKRDQQQPTLSAAAAAAALRARPSTPTNVAQVQTKRTARRSASVSSTGRAPDIGQQNLRRRESSASMAERTFRSPSPGARSVSRTDDRQSILSQEPTPPVPPLPKHVNARGAQSGKGEHRKTQSLGLSNPPFRVASEKFEETGLPSWYVGAHVGDLSNVRTSDAAMASPPLSPPPRLAYQDDDERPDSRNSSINFSYPSRLRVGSPAPSPTAADFKLPLKPPGQERGVNRTPSVASSVRSRPASTTGVESLVYDPNSRRMVPRVDPYVAEQDAHGSFAKPARKKKSKQISQTGSHLSQGTMGRTKTAPEAAATYAAASHRVAHQQQPESTHATLQTRHVPAEQRRIPRESQQVEYEEASNQPVPTEIISEEGPDMVEEEPAVKSLIASPRSETTRAQQHRAAEPESIAQESLEDQVVSAPRDRRVIDGLRRQPSVVKEESEPDSDEDEDMRDAEQTVSAALDAVPTRQKVYGSQLQQTNLVPVSKPRAVSLQPQQTPGVQRLRSLSTSPTRTARFGGVQSNLSVKHSPPARSVSPRKSAMKHSVSPSRGGHEIDDSISESSSGVNRPEEGSVSRKKSVRVSFDDDSMTVVGQSPVQALGDSPVSASPQQAGRRPWYSNIGRSKKQEFVALDEDEIMKPRPVLPSFGSVRDKKPRDATTGEEGRPLVRPAAEPVVSPPLTTAPSPVTTPEPLPPVPHVSEELDVETTYLMSTDSGTGHSAGNTPSELDKTKIPANTSRFREPLPPVVTSVEGSGYLSDSSTSSEEEEGNGIPLAQTTSQVEGERFSTPEPEPTVQKQEVGSADLLAATHPNVPVQETMSSPGVPQETSTVSEQGEAVEHDVPTISISQPTPQLGGPSAHYFGGVPGGFPEDESEASTPAQELDGNPVGLVPETALNITSDDGTPGREATFEPVSSPADATQTSHTPSTVTATLVPVAEEDDDTGSSIYSDAPDHFTDDEDGFMSLDAVVERSVGQGRGKNLGTESQSPVEQATSTEGHDAESQHRYPAHLSTATTAVESQNGEQAPYDWDKAKAYWRSLTAERRAQLEREAVDDAAIDADLEEDTQAPTKPKRKKSTDQRAVERQALAVHMAQQMMAAQQQPQVDKTSTATVPSRSVDKPQNSERSYQIKPGTKVVTKRTTPRSPPNADEAATKSSKDSEASPRFRKSMRANGTSSRASEADHSRATGMAGKTLRAGSGLQSTSQVQGTKAPRRVSSPPLPTGAASAAMNTARNSGVSASLRRRDSTDSESSFKRARQEPAQGFGFRKTLRQPSPSPAAAPTLRGRAPRPASSRFSLRSLSPTGSHFSHASPSSGMGMRASLRSSAADTRKTGGGGSLFGGLGKSSGKTHSKSASRSSRFGDSSDEDEPPRKGSTFRSRFGDSSDEDEVLPLPAISQSMPRTLRTGKRVEAALPEEDETDDERPYVDTEKRILSSPGHTNDVFGSPTISSPKPAIDGRPKPSSRRGSFMSILRRKKDKNSGGVTRPERMDSAARRDTPLERSAAELETIRRSGDMDRDETLSPSRPLSPRRLSKRTNSMTLDSAISPGAENWPLATSESGRPGTAGNLGTRTMSGYARPEQRRTMSANLLDNNPGGEKKKKKFGALRKMFGLDD